MNMYVRIFKIDVLLQYILANDPDADRLGVAEKVNGTWKILSGNDLGALLGWWCLKTFKGQI